MVFDDRFKWTLEFEGWQLASLGFYWLSLVMVGCSRNQEGSTCHKHMNKRLPWTSHPALEVEATCVPHIYQADRMLGAFNPTAVTLSVVPRESPNTFAELH